MAISASTLWGSVNYDENGKRITSDTSSRNVSSQLDRDAFLNLMMTQMQYQDPLNPMDNSQFLAQMAQFTSLEQMQNMSATTRESSAFSLLGKYVDTLSYNKATFEYEEFSGLVSSVSKISGEVYLMIDEKMVLASSVVNVYPDYISSQVSTINSSVMTSQNIALIGKYVQAITLNSENEQTGFVEGRVDYVKFDSEGTPILMVGDKEIFGAEVVSVSDKMMLIGKDIQYEEKDSETGTSKNFTGKIEDVKIKDDKAYLVVDGKQVEVDKINYVTEALSYIGKEVKYGDVSGEVEGVVLYGGFPYFKLGDGILSYTTYKGIK